MDFAFKMMNLNANFQGENRYLAFQDRNKAVFKWNVTQKTFVPVRESSAFLLKVMFPLRYCFQTRNNRLLASSFHSSTGQFSMEES